MKPNYSILKSCAVAFSLLAFVGCGREELDVAPVAEQHDCSSHAEEAFPNTHGSLHTIHYRGKTLQVERIGDSYVLEGDIVIPVDYDSKSTAKTSAQWPGGIVYYKIDRNLPNQSRVVNAIAHWEQNTPIRFVKRTTEPNYVLFKKGTGCSSYVGRIGGSQQITLADGCTTGSTIHEIGHAIGLWHEQSRKDRDQFITINSQNIKPGKEHNFQTYEQKREDGYEYSSFDFGSIMLYGSYAFYNPDRPRRPTITKKDGSTFTSQRNRLSPKDIEGVTILYNSEPLCRYYSQSLGRHHYTTDYNLLKRGNNTYRYEGVAGLLLSNNSFASGLKPIYRYTKPTTGEFYTSNFNELGNGAQGYTYRGVLGYVYPNNAPGRKALYRYCHKGNESHFYTTNFNELRRGNSVYRYEGVLGYMIK